MATPIHQFEGKYEILEKIAEGGMGALYKVRHRLLDEIRVIKVMRPQLEQQEGIKARFLREARLAIKMRQTNIAQLYDFSMDDTGNAFIVMEYIDGITLQELLQRSGPPPMAVTLEVAQQSLLALGYLHRKKVVHRDISPDNLMLSADDLGDPLVKLIDLGIAKALQADGGLTATGMFVGKIRYASPEHFKPDEGTEIDQRSDLYSFGLVLYEMLTGKHPIEGTNFSTLIAGHLFRPPMEFATSDPGGKVPDDLRAVVLKALAKAPDDRFATAKLFREQILEIQGRFHLSSEEFERVFSLRVMSPPTQKIKKPGSTQDRINVEFRGATPAPDTVSGAGDGLTEQLDAAAAEVDVIPFDRKPASATPPPPPPPATEAGKDQIDALLAAAEHLAELNMYSEAKLQLRSALQIDDGNVRVREQLAKVEEDEKRSAAISQAVESIRKLLADHDVEGAAAAIDKAVSSFGELEETADLRQQVAEAREEQRVAALADAASAARVMIDAGHLDKAQAHIDDAVGRLGESTELSALRALIFDLEERHRAEAVAALVTEAQALLADHRYKDAMARLREALEIRPGDADIEAQLAAATAAQRRYEGAQRRAQSVAKLSAEVEQLIVKEKFKKARAAIDKAEDRMGKADELVALRENVQQREAEAVAARVAGHMEEAGELLTHGLHDRAIAQLEKAFALDPENSEVASRLEEARAGLAQAAEAKRIADGLAKVAAAVNRLVDKDRFDDARQAIAEAEKEYGENDELSGLLERVNAQEAEWRGARVASLVREAQGLLADERFEDAIARLEDAGQLDPEDSGVHAQLADSRAAYERHQVSQQVAEAIAAVEALLESGKLEEARSEIDAAIDRHGPVDELNRLSARLSAIVEEQRLEAQQREEAERAAAETERAAAEEAERAAAAEAERAAAAEAERAAAEEAERTRRLEAVPAPGGDEAPTTRLEAVKDEPPPEVSPDDTIIRKIEPEPEPEPEPERVEPPREDETTAVPVAVPAAPTEPRPAVKRLPAARRAPAKPVAAPRLSPAIVRLLIAGAAVVVVCVILVVVFRGGKETAPVVDTGPSSGGGAVSAELGVLVVAAAPWGEVVRIVDANGAAHELPAQAETPLRVALAPGQYFVAVEGLRGENEETLEVEVVQGEVVRVHARLKAIDADEFLRAYGIGDD